MHHLGPVSCGDLADRLQYIHNWERKLLWDQPSPTTHPIHNNSGQKTTAESIDHAILCEHHHRTALWHLPTDWSSAVQYTQFWAVPSFDARWEIDFYHYLPCIDCQSHIDDFSIPNPCRTIVRGDFKPIPTQSSHHSLPSQLTPPTPPEWPLAIFYVSVLSISFGSFISRFDHQRALPYRRFPLQPFPNGLWPLNSLSSLQPSPTDEPHWRTCPGNQRPHRHLGRTRWFQCNVSMYTVYCPIQINYERVQHGTIQTGKIWYYPSQAR